MSFCPGEPRYGGRKGGKANRQAGPIASFHVSIQGNVHVLPVLAWLANFLAVPRPTAKNLFLLMTWSFAEGSGKRAPRKRGGVGFGCECRVADSAERDGGRGPQARRRKVGAKVMAWWHKVVAFPVKRACVAFAARVKAPSDGKLTRSSLLLVYSDRSMRTIRFYEFGAPPQK
ncbi:hypothetical protein B296_00014992 [Ensete ventricosum]|uniref:Uncharacterized protein n=1 Tax=Ensete ventricosum TaxID=4639 RepID=A0A427A875_ENSVE|nr:hypothetical protein B296_00014992 [Ensete ventricosum]